MATRHRTVVKSGPTDLPLLIFGVIAFMYFTAEVTKPLALSVLLSFALTPASRWFERLGLPRVSAVVLTVVLVLGALGTVGFVVGEQLTTLSEHLPEYQETITTKLNTIRKPDGQGGGGGLRKLISQLATGVESPSSTPPDQAAPAQNVVLVQSPVFPDRVRGAIGPTLEVLGVGSFVFILVLFMLMGRERFRDRIVGLFGNRHIGLTTRTLEEIGLRISRYLGTLAMVNSGAGLVVGLGLWLVGIPYALLWGSLVAMLRFIPYLGPTVAFLLPMIFSIAHFPGWTQPVEVFALFAVVEAVLAGYLEPVIYGKTTGLSSLGLLIAAMFWTWMWGTLGLLLSTPMTVCLAVLGKYVSSLRFFAILLDEQSELTPDVRLYQRLVAFDREGAMEVVAGVIKNRPRVEVFDQVLVPTLSRVERDAARGELDEGGQEFVWQVFGEVLDWLEDVEEFDLASVTPTNEGDAKKPDRAPHSQDGPVIGIAVQDTSDLLVLRMLGQLLTRSQITLKILPIAETPLQLAELVADISPRLAFLSHLPPQGLTPTRYILRRLHSQFASMPIIVGRWGETSAAKSDADRLTAMGATHTVFTLADARDRILGNSPVVANKGVESTVAPLPA